MDITKSTIVAIPEGKILDFLTKRLVNDTPEEYVRQNIEKALVRQYKYPVKDCEPEFSIKVGSANKRVDVVVFESDAHHKQENAFILNYSRRYGTEPARCHVWVGGYKTGNAQSFPHRKGYTTPLGVLGLF